MSQPLHITLIGAGNVAWHLGAALARHNIIDTVFSRHLHHAQQLAAITGGQAIDQPGQMPTGSDIYIMAVCDDAVAPLCEALPPLNGLVAHTSGSVPISSLQRFNRHGVFYPFQTFSKQKEVCMEEVPMLLEANTPSDLGLLGQLASSISNRVMEASSQQRLQLHIAAVFACNFTNHLYGIASDILGKASLPFDLLHPLLHETTQKACTMDPYLAQTGPAVRGDAQVVNKHLMLLRDHPQWQQLYRMMSLEIAGQHGVGLKEEIV